MKIFIITLSLFASVAHAESTYFVAPETEVTNVVNLGSVNTEVTLSYQLPCWAQYVDILKTVAVKEPMNFASNFEVVIGVLLKGNTMNPCVGSQDMVTKTIVSTHAVEGSFDGFKIIEKL